MSPEQAAGREDIDGRADVWSLGVVLYESLTGTLPHQAANYNALMVRILTQDSDPVMTRKPDLPPSICAIVDACLKRERDERTSNAATLAKQMDGALREMKAMRFRSLGRRAADRTPGAMQQRSTDFAPDSANGQGDGKSRALSTRSVALVAAGAGFALGMLLLLVVVLVLGGKR